MCFNGRRDGDRMVRLILVTRACQSGEIADVREEIKKCRRSSLLLDSMHCHARESAKCRGRTVPSPKED